MASEKISDPLMNSAQNTENVPKWLQILHYRPLMSILMPVYNTDPEILRKSLNSVLRQAYKKWELCIVDDASDRADVRPILESYAEKSRNISIIFSDKNEGIAATINKSAEMASGAYLGVLDHDDELDPFILLEYVRLINRRPDADCIYCDEDKIDEQGNYCEPWFKSDWNPDLSLSFNYVMHFVMCRRGLFEEVGGVRTRYEGSQDYDLLLRISERTDKIYHVPKILYHWRKGSGSIASGPEAKPGVFVSGLAALRDTLKSRNISGDAEDAPGAWKGVYRVRRKIVRFLSCSVLLLSYGDEAALSRALESIFSNLPRRNFEILICIASSLNLQRNAFLKRHKGGMIVKRVKIDRSSGVASAFNEGARHASGDLLFFLDETMELMSRESFTQLIEHIQREEVGAVGGKVCYDNGLIEHGGVILGPFNVLGYAHRATPDGPGYAGLNCMICNYSAVMGLGMMTRRKLFTDIGGFDKGFGKAYWDADYCLRLRERGYLITYTPYSKFHHHIPVKAIHEMIAEPDATRFRCRWQHVIDADPYFNPNFSRSLENFSFE